MTSQLEVLETKNERSQNEHCPNCEADLTGEYCHRCGQKRIHHHEFGVRHFFGHVVHEFTHLDSNKIFKTVIALLFKPGLLTAEYLGGRKGRYANPIRIYLTCSAIYFLFAWGTLSGIRGGGVDSATRSPRIIAMAQKKGLDPKAMAEKFYQKAEKLSAALRFTSVLMSGLFLTLLYYGMKKYYVEHLVFSLHYYSFDFFCKSVFALLFIVAGAVGANLPAQVLNLFYPLAFIYLIFALRSVYKESWVRTVSKALVLFACETLLFIAVNIAGFIIASSLV